MTSTDKPTTGELRELLAKAPSAPWEIEPYDHSDKDIMIVPPVARVDYDDVNHDEQDAAAALIALAPTIAAELIEARETLRKIAAMEPDVHWQDGSIMWVEYAADVKAHATMALAKGA